MKNLWFTNFILTVIACLLAWTVIHKPAATVFAQDAVGQFTISTIADPSVLTSDGISGWNQDLNTAVGTGDIVAAVALPNQHQIALIVKGRR
jgi:hypothetical protein